MPQLPCGADDAETEQIEDAVKELVNSNQVAQFWLQQWPTRKAARMLDQYQGHPTWQHWNVSLYLFNEENFYRPMVNIVSDSADLEEATERMLYHLRIDKDGIPEDREWLIRDRIIEPDQPFYRKTRDGAVFTYDTILYAMANGAWFWPSPEMEEHLRTE